MVSKTPIPLLKGSLTEIEGRPRDSQRQKVYDSENAAFPIMQAWCDTFASIQDVQTYVNSVVSSRWWKAHSDITKVTVKDGRGCRSAYAYDVLYFNTDKKEREALGLKAVGFASIGLPKGFRNKNVVLHELSHLLTENPDLAWHGPEFCKAYLALVKRFLGKLSYDILVYEFKRHNVKYRTGWKVQQFHWSNKEK